MHFLITAGGTREYIDPVRFISNASSGRMGIAIARSAMKAGHSVTLVTATTTQRLPDAAKIIKAETADEMFRAVKKEFRHCDCLLSCSILTPIRVWYFLHLLFMKMNSNDKCQNPNSKWMSNDKCQKPKPINHETTQVGLRIAPLEERPEKFRDLRR